MGVRRSTTTWARRSAAAGAVASACFTVGDLLLLGRRGRPAEHQLLREETDLHDAAETFLGSSTTRMRAGGLWGVLSSPLHIASAWQLYDALRPTGTARAARIAGTYAGAWAMASYIHGAFYPWGAAFHTAEAADPGTPQRAAALGQAAEIERSVEIPYAVFGAALAGVSVEVSMLAALGRTRYPRWSAPLVTPLLPVAVTLAATKLLPTRHRERWEGAGISLGVLASNIAAAAVHRS
ncbi:DUF6796 family protein [Rhodococcus yananensis]|uniref:DUF6796 family protein n=1 Tax=Rhodococcus yananensis TaxID=2879464 RepID=UPI003EBC2557